MYRTLVTYDQKYLSSTASSVLLPGAELAVRLYLQHQIQTPLKGLRRVEQLVKDFLYT